MPPVCRSGACRALEKRLSRTKAGLLVLLLLLVTTRAPATESINIVEVRSIAAAVGAPAAAASHDLKLYVHTFRGTRWGTSDIVEAVMAATTLLTQCGVTLAKAELRVIEAPARFRIYYTPVSKELLRAIETPKPALFFVEDTRNQPAFDAEAIGLANAKTRQELANTVWVAYGAKDLPLALAHELVHVLSDSGEHSAESGNLMQSETSPENTRLTASQCEHLRRRSEASGLLQRRP